MKTGKREKRNVPEFKPPEPNIIESIKPLDSQIELEKLINAVVIDHDFFCLNNFYVYEINFPLESKLKHIQYNSFCQLQLYSITLPPSLSSILPEAFKNCSNLIEVNFSKNESNKCSLFHICDEAFRNTKIQSIIIPYSVKDIGSFCFPKTLSKIEFEDGCPNLKKIGDSTFSSTQIETINLPSRITNLKNANNVFHHCHKLQEIRFDQFDDTSPELISSARTKEQDDKKRTVLNQGKIDFSILSDISQDFGKSFLFSQTNIKKLQVRSSELNYFSFYNTPNLTSIEITNPEDSRYYKQLKCIYTSDFKKLILAERDIQSATIESLCEIITNYAFSTQSLKSVIFPKKSHLEEISIMAFSNSQIEEINLPNSVNLIGYGAFSRCNQLHSVKLSTSLRFIDYLTFAFTNLTKITIPKNVVCICFESFMGCLNLNEVIFEDDSQLNEIDDYAFACTNISTIKFPKTLIRLGSYCFYKCYNLHQVIFENISNLKSIGTNVFMNTQIQNKDVIDLTSKFHPLTKNTQLYTNPYLVDTITHIEIPSSVTQIGSCAFSHCQNLIHFKILDLTNSKLEKIGNAAFYKCESLVTFDLPESVRFFGEFAFANCPYFKASIKSVSKNSIYINNHAFTNSGIMKFDADCKQLFVSDFAFQNCSNLKSFTSSASYRWEISKSTFSDCGSLETVELNQNVTWAEIGEECFMNSSIHSFTIPNHLTKIPQGCFKFCKQLRNIYIDTTNCEITAIDSEAFLEAAIERIKIPKHTSNISDHCFEKCKNLRTVRFATRNKLQTIGYKAFSGTGIQSLLIPLVRKIKSGCFENCSDLKEVYFPAKPFMKEIGEEVFKSTGIEHIDIPFYIGKIGKNCFRDCSNLRTVAFHHPFTIIYFSTFANCHNLTKITLSDDEDMNDYHSLKNIDYYYFHYSYSHPPFLRIVDTVNHRLNIQFKENDLSEKFIKTFIAGDINNHYKPIIEYSIPMDDILVFDNEFQYDEPFQLYIEEETKTLPIQSGRYINGVFYSFSKDELIYFDSSTDAVIVPNVTTFFRCNAFENSQLKKIDFEPNSQLTTICSNCFGNCLLEEITFPDSLKIIDKFAFQNCYKLVKVVIPDNSKLTSIGESAFQNCCKLVKVVVPNNSKLTSIGESAFQNCAMDSIVLPSDLQIIGKNAFRFCSNLKEVNNYSTQEMEFFDYSFSSTPIEEIKFPPKCKFHIGCFSNCRNLKQLQFISPPEDLLFQVDSFTCTGLESIDIQCPSTFEANSFSFCSLLSGINIASEKSVFKGNPFVNSKITKIFLEGNVSVFNYDQFERSTRKEIINSNIKQLCLTLNVTKKGKYKSNCKVTFYYNHNCLSINNTLVDVNPIDQKLFMETTTTPQIKNNEVLKISAIVKKVNCNTIPHIKRIDFGKNCFVKEIGSFAYSNLMEITIPKSVKQITAYTFDHCQNLRRVQFEAGSKISEIGEYAFSNTKIRKVILPDTVKIIKQYAFAYNNSLKTVDFHGEIIEDNAFMYTGLVSFNLPNSTKRIGSGAFQYCSKLTEFNIDIQNSQLTKINEYAFNNSSIIHINIPAGIECIKQYTFHNCEKLVSVDFSPESNLESIGESSFSGDVSLTQINIPKTIEEISKTAFINTPSLLSIMKESNFKYIVMDNHEVYSKENTEMSLLFVPSNISEFSLLEDCSTICSSAFSFSSIEQLNLTNGSLRVIEKGAFAHCNRIKQITIPSTICTIEDEAFMDCQNLETVIFESNCQLKVIPKYCFAFSALKQINFHKSIEIIDDMSFYLCSNLEQIDLFNTNVKYIGNSAFESTSIERIILPHHIKYINSLAFANIKSLKSIDFTNFTKASIWANLPENYAISTCKEKYLKIKTTDPKILRMSSNGESTENSSPDSQTISYENGLNDESDHSMKSDLDKESNICYLHELAFLHTSASLVFDKIDNDLYSVLFKDFHYKNMDDYILHQCGITIFTPEFSCRNLTTIHLPSCSLTSIEKDLFCNSPKLKQITIPSTVCSIEEGSFMNCYNLETVIFDPNSTIKIIPKYCFAFSALKQINFPESIEIIDDMSFYFCRNLERVDIFNTNVTYIGYSAFELTSIEQIVFPPTIQYVHSHSFANIKSLKTIDFSFCSQPKDWHFIPAPTWYSKMEYKKIRLSILDSEYDGERINHHTSYYLHEFAFWHASGSFIFNSNDYIWLACFDHCDHVHQYTVNPKITLYLQKSDYALPYANKLLNDNHRISKLIWLTDEILPSKISVMHFLTSTKLKFIDISNMAVLKYIQPNTFRSTKIGKICLPPSLLKIGFNAFASCECLESVTFGKEPLLKRIEKSAFYECKSLKTIEIPNGITQIPFKCFALSGLTSIVLPRSIKQIDEYAFFKCYNLAQLTLNEGLTKIGESAFCFLTSLKSVNLPESLQIMEQDAFSNCSNLSKVIIPEGSQLESLQQGVFDSSQIEELILATNISKIYAPLNVPKLKLIDFHSTPRNTLVNNKYKVNDDGSLYLNTNASINEANMASESIYALIFAPKNLKKLTIPCFCHKIGKYALQGMKNLQSIEYSEGNANYLSYRIQGDYDLKLKSVRLLGAQCFIDNSFFNMSSLEIVEFGDSSEVKCISNFAFWNCQNLKKVTISGCTEIGKSAFANCVNLTTITFNSTKLSTIRKNAFYNCSSLEQFNVPVVLTIEKSAFMNCKKLKFVNIGLPTDLTADMTENIPLNIHGYAFANCISLENFKTNIPFKLGEGSFMNCQNLKSMLIISKSSLLKFPYDCFYNCTSLENIELTFCQLVLAVEIGSGCFMNCTSLKNLSIDDTKRDSYLNQATENGVPIDLKKLEKKVQKIDQYAFYDCKSLEHVRIFDGRIDWIGNNAFGNCTSLKYLEFGSKFEMKCLQTKLLRNSFIGANANLKIELHNPDNILSLNDLIYINDAKRHFKTNDHIYDTLVGTNETGIKIQPNSV